MQRRQFDLPSWSAAAPVALALSLAAALSSGCGPAAGGSSAFDLEHGLATATHCQVELPDKLALEFVRAQLALHPVAGLEFELHLHEQRSRARGSQPRIWVGTPNSGGCEAALEKLGVERIRDGFRFLGQDFAGRDDGLIATVRDPERAGAVLEIVLGNEVRSALDWVRDWTPTSRLGWQVFRAARIEREGGVDASGAASPAGQVDVAALDAELSKDRAQGERPLFDWIAPPSFDPASDENWLMGLDRAADGTYRRLGPITPFDVQARLTLRIFQSSEELARVARSRAAAQLRMQEPQPELSLLHVEGWPDNAAFELARGAAIASAGEPRAAWLLDAVAGAAADSWFGRSRNPWLAHLWTGGLIPPVAELAAERGELSPHVARPLRGALLLVCEELHGADFAARNWASAAEAIALPSDEAFRAWLGRAVEGELDRARRSRDERREASRSRPTRRGACLVASRPAADPLGGGFGSRACEISLARLRGLGADAVALSWCAALEPSEPRVFGAGPAHFTQADDQALFATILRARELGMSVVLLPQLLATENGGWAGQVMLTTPRTQREFFQALRRSLTHLGLLAELAGVDVLSLGTEAPDTAVTRQFDQNRRAPKDLGALLSDWQLMIEASRSAFSGGLTYAARWDGEALGIEFWKELDFIGQNLFMPFDGPMEKDSPNANEFSHRILWSFENLARMAQANGVRPLVCGIGMSSTREGWRHPSRPHGPVDLELQARYYEGLVRALQIGRRREFAPAGIFAWCWSSDPDSGGALDRGFTPQNKPAEAVLGRALQLR